MSKVIRLSKSGFNAQTDTDPNNMVFDSRYGTLMYHLSGSVNLTVSGSNAETSINHNLGYIPFFVAYVNRLSPSNTWSMCPQTFNDFGVYLYINAYATTSKIYFRAETASASNTLNFYYKVFRNNTGL